MKLDKKLTDKQRRNIFDKLLARARGDLRNYSSRYERFGFPRITNDNLINSLQYDDPKSLYALLFHPKLACRIWTSIPICEECHNLLFDEVKEDAIDYYYNDRTYIITYSCKTCKKEVNGDQTCYEFMMENLAGLVNVAELEQNEDLMYNYLDNNLKVVDRAVKKRIDEDLAIYPSYQKEETVVA